MSKIGDFAYYGSDPRRIEYAGADTDGLSVDYKAKYAAQQQVIKDNYKTFDVPYNGTDNDNYADGEGFCCNDGSMEAAMAQAQKAQVRAVAIRTGDRSLSRKIINRSSLIHNRKQCQDEDAYNPARESIMS